MKHFRSIFIYIYNIAIHENGDLTRTRVVVNYIGSCNVEYSIVSFHRKYVILIKIYIKKINNLYINDKLDKNYKQNTPPTMDIALWCGTRISSLHLPTYVVRGWFR